jgi:hypothetical protein
MVDACGMTELNGIDELEHDILDCLGVARDTTLEDILVQVSEVAVLKNEEGILFGFEGVDAVDDVFGSGERGIEFCELGVKV